MIIEQGHNDVDKQSYIQDVMMIEGCQMISCKHQFSMSICNLHWSIKNIKIGKNQKEFDKTVGKQCIRMFS